jgi:hypothetical protein
MDMTGLHIYTDLITVLNTLDMEGHMVPAKCKYADSKNSAYLRGTCLKTKKYQTNIGAPPVRKYAIYRSLIYRRLLCFVLQLSILLSFLHSKLSNKVIFPQLDLPYIL